MSTAQSIKGSAGWEDGLMSPKYKLQDTGKAIEIGLESFDKRMCVGSNLPKQCLEKEPSVKKKREVLLL